MCKKILYVFIYICLGVFSLVVKLGVINCVVEFLNNLFINLDIVYVEMKIWNFDICYSEDDLFVYVKYFIVDCV